MTLDWDGQIRMDPSSPYAMQRLISWKDRCDIAFACDTDHDRHGIVTPTHGLLPPNHSVCLAIAHLFRHRPLWGAQVGIGKTVVSTPFLDAADGICAASGWFAARPSGAEANDKIDAESFRSAEHLQTLVRQAQAMVDVAMGLP